MAIDNDPSSRPDKETCFNHYEKTLAQWGHDVRALWGSAESQQVRFSVLSEIANLEGKKILDVGCGFGDFLGFLNEKGVKPEHYTGIDINPKMIEKAKLNFPKATFEVTDILDYPIMNTADFVFASGIFGLDSPNWDSLVQKTLTRMFELCDIGVGVNFLSSLTKGQKPAVSHFADPMQMIRFASRELSTNLVLRHDYRANDFTLYIYKPYQ